MSGLEETFGPSARSRPDLAGMLAPRPRTPPPSRPAAAPEAEPEPSPTKDHREEEEPQAPQPRQRPRRAAAASAPPPEPGVSYQVSVYVLPAARSRARARREAEGLTNAEIAFAAIDSLQHRLAGLVAQRRTTPPAEGSLFPPRVSRRRRPGGDPGATEGRRVLWALQATTEELRVLDRLVKSSGAESRSELISVALEAALLPRR